MPRRRQQRSSLRQNALQVIAILAVFVGTRFLLITYIDDTPAETTRTTAQNNETNQRKATASSESSVCPTSNPTVFAVNELKTLIKQMRTFRSGHKQKLFQKYEKRLAEITKILDPLYVHHPPIAPVVPSNKRKEFCVEKFTHLSNAEDHYFLNGSWESGDCGNLIPIEKLVSVVLYSDEVSHSCSSTVTAVLLSEAIQKTHPKMKVYVASNAARCKMSPMENVDIFEIESDWNYGEVFNKLLRRVKTPYVLVGRHLYNFSWLAQLRRQVSVLAQLEHVKVVGGSIRNETGHWQVGCQQTSMESNVLEYRDGYYSSRRECMFCDHLLGPFVAETEILRRIPFDEDLPRAVVFDDWFLQLKGKQHLVMNCPDAMYFYSDPDTKDKSSNRTTWLPLVKNRQLNRIFLPNDIELAYSCDESGITCSHLEPILPICCMDQIAYNMHAFHADSLARNIWYNYIGAYVLGAIKFQGIMPWEMFSGKMHYTVKPNLLWEPNIEQTEQHRNVYADHIAVGFSVIWSPNTYNVSQTSSINTERTIDEILHQTPTLMQVHGVWVHGPPSPGLHARNVYGKDYLKKTGMWEHTGKGSWSPAQYIQPLHGSEVHPNYGQIENISSIS